MTDYFDAESGGRPTARSNFVQYRCNSFFERVATKLLLAVGKYEVKNTSVLPFLLSNHPKYSKEAPRYLMGASIMTVGRVIANFDFDKFLAQTDHEKTQAVLDFVYHHLVEFAKHFGLPTQPFEDGYRKVKGKDLVFVDEKGKMNKGRQYRAHYKIIEKFDSTEYFLVMNDVKEKTTKELFICEKKHFYGVEYPQFTIHDFLQIDMHLKYEGWVDATTYGMNYNEVQYLYRADEGRLEKLSREVNINPELREVLRAM